MLFQDEFSFFWDEAWPAKMSRHDGNPCSTLQLNDQFKSLDEFVTPQLVTVDLNVNPKVF